MSADPRIRKELKECGEDNGSGGEPRSDWVGWGGAGLSVDVLQRSVGCSAVCGSGWGQRLRVG